MEFAKSQKQTKKLTTYIGQKGYTIIKNELSKEQEEFIKKSLTIRPFTQGSPVNVQTTFPAYRESKDKYYVPRYFGEKNFGPPLEYKLKEGVNISLEFKGILRDYQEPVVKKYIDYVKSFESAGGLLELPCAWGKTSGSLYILSQLNKKTIVIVHKEFLMNQWIERIQQFLPDARIGKIQGKIIDIEDKDIVLCMLQTVSMKELPSNIFDSFGFTIIDEVHHISSEVFSNTLFKLVTKYMLGLSATMNRKDGTTHVFKMFLGDVIYKGYRKDEHDVVVRAIHYKTNDDEFNETVLDYKGNPQISTMISKICDYNNRTEFIIKVLCDFISVNDNKQKEEMVEYKKKMDKEVIPCKMCKNNCNYLMKNTCCGSVNYCLLCLEKIVEHAKQNPELRLNKKTGEQKTVKTRAKCPECFKVLMYEQNYICNPYIKPLEQLQTIILAHNLNILEYIYRKIVCKNLCSVGYYVGGMSEQELKKSEKRQVVLATFQMAAEALDIPSLNAEFLITPKTDIEQSVGRILRAKHATTNPIIYDFVDKHELFQKQFLKRKTFYKKQNYKIIETDNSKYNTTYESPSWRISFNGKKCTQSSSDSSDSSDGSDDDNNNNKDKILTGKCLINIKK